MMPTVQFLSVGPIGDTDPRNLPVKDLEKAIAYYTDTLGFALRARAETPPLAIIYRDAVEIGLAENGGDPEQASCYIGVTNVEAVYREWEQKGVDVSDSVKDMAHDGKVYRVFFAKDPDGLCYCIGTPK